MAGECVSFDFVAFFKTGFYLLPGKCWPSELTVTFLMCHLVLGVNSVIIPVVSRCGQLALVVSWRHAGGLMKT